MTSEKYFEELARISNDLSGGVQEVIKKLDDLFAVKPVRTKWFVAKATAMFKAGYPIEDLYEFLNGKVWYTYVQSGVVEMATLYTELNASYGDMTDATRNRLQPWVYIEDLDGINRLEVERLKSELRDQQENFLNEPQSLDNLKKLHSYYFQLSNYVECILISCLIEQHDKTFESREFIKDIPNYGYLCERVISESNETFIIVATDENMTDCEVAATVLSSFNKKIYLLVQPLECPVDYEIDMTETVAISMENMQECDGVQVITPLEALLDGEVIGDNRAQIIDYLARECSEKGLATILVSGELMDTLCELPILQKQMERLNNFMADGLEKNLSFGWVGNYLTYISQIYEFDAEEAINQPAECDFSIVIPARNSAYSLRHTLQTCLDIEYAGSYEIVVSDNSTNGNQEVYNLICELNDDRIKYYKTPRDLHLPKSFEFAFLKARGEFIFSIGSDDGVLPGSLDVLKEVLEAYPDEQIIQWDRGFYAWPGFNAGQENQFVIPRYYRKGNRIVRKVRSMEILAAILDRPSSMYRLPMLYINSGFRRSYFKTLIDKTGRLWDGICQDIYMGVINIAINKEVLTVEYPVTIAGMTNASIGKISNAATTTVTEAQKSIDAARKSSNVGGFSMSRTERLMPELRSDVSSLYNSLLRAVARGVMPRVYLEQLFDWKKMYLDCIALMDKADLFFDKNVHYMRYTATKHGEEFLKWFDEKVYPVLMQPELRESGNQNVKTGKLYEVGFRENGGLVLDASLFGVENIKDAVRLFVNIVGL